MLLFLQWCLCPVDHVSCITSDYCFCFIFSTLPLLLRFEGKMRWRYFVQVSFHVVESKWYSCRSQWVGGMYPSKPIWINWFDLQKLIFILQFASGLISNAYKQFLWAYTHFPQKHHSLHSHEEYTESATHYTSTLFCAYDSFPWVCSTIQ